MAILGSRGHVKCSNALRAAEYPWRSTCCMPNNIWGLPDTPTQPHPTPSTYLHFKWVPVPIFIRCMPPRGTQGGPTCCTFS